MTDAQFARLEEMFFGRPTAVPIGGVFLGLLIPVSYPRRP